MRAFPLVLLAVLSVPALQPAQAQTAREVTLAEAIALAARHDPTVIQAEGGLRGADAGVRTAYSAFFPSISGSASGGSSFSEGRDRVDPITGEVISGDFTSKSASFGVSAGMDLFNGFRNTADLRAARGRQEQSEANLSNLRAQSARGTSLAFFAALQTRELVRVREATVARAQEQLTVAVARLATRAATVQDSLRAVVQLGEARLALVSELARLAADEAALARRLGLEGRVAARDEGLAPTALELDTAQVLAEALSRAPSVLQADAAVRTSQASLAAARASYFPTIRLSGNYNYSGSSSTDYTFFNSRGISLSVSVPLFQGLGREEQMATRGATLDADRARAADARREVAATLTAQFAALDAARQRIALTQLSMQAAEADVAVALARYRLGTLQSISDLNQAQSGLTNAQQSAVLARFEYLRAKAEIEAILGRPL